MFREFAGDVTTSLSQNPNFQTPGAPATFVLDPGSTLTTSRMGTYGQFALGAAAVFGNTGWLGYGRVDYRVGENIEGWSVNAGLRYQFTPEQRRSIKDGIVPAIYAYNWTGAYIGGFAGRMWGREDWTFVGAGTTVDPNFGGYLFGGQAGYNVQVGHVVLGVESDYGFSNARGGKQCPGFFYTCDAEAERLASVTGRLGFTAGRALFYAKGGWAVGEVTASTTLDTPVGSILAETPAATTKWLNGWTVGGGMEFALTDRWSAKGEYMHYDLGQKQFVVTTLGGTPASIAEVGAHGDTVRVGINYHFYPRVETVSLK